MPGGMCDKTRRFDSREFSLAAKVFVAHFRSPETFCPVDICARSISTYLMSLPSPACHPR
ncbi:hypothetical protein [Lysobacter gummosus]|uniref:hypothetical protein n=1 Tax=Lysobacter gummosus TaxID=262324 RepID=UPI003641A04C